MTATALFKTQPPPDQVTKGAASAYCLCINNAIGVWKLAAPGTPVNGVAGTGTGGGWAAIGSEYTDTTAGKLYINTGTKASPVWTVVGTQT